MVGENLGEGDAGMIIDGDMNILPPTPVGATSAAIGTKGDPGKTTELFDVEVEQIAGSSMFVANHGHRWFQVAHAVETQATKNPADGGAA